MDEQEKVQLIDQHRFGKWMYKNQEFNVLLEITENEIVIKSNNSDFSDSFDAYGHFMGSYFVYLNPNPWYIISAASEDSLTFGKAKNSTINDPEWEFEFTRI